MANTLFVGHTFNNLNIFAIKPKGYLLFNRGIYIKLYFFKLIFKIARAMGLAKRYDLFVGPAVHVWQFFFGHRITHFYVC